MGSRTLAAKRSRKRVIRVLTDTEKDRLRESASYEGSPLHKREPNNFGLTPPAAPRPDKTLCDEAGILDREMALRLFEHAIELGLASESTVASGLPKHLWAVDELGRGFEAIHGGSRGGAYHGYPIRRSDPFHEMLMERWRDAGGRIGTEDA